MTKCPCNADNSFQTCCEPFISGHALPKTPEALMRSRYTAYTLANTDYIKQTMMGKASINFNPDEAFEWAKRVRWLGLIVLKAHGNKVEYVARFIAENKEQWIHEISEFKQIDNRWYYTNGIHPQNKRNEPCPCGSGKKFKRCHAVILNNA